MNIPSHSTKRHLDETAPKQQGRDGAWLSRVRALVGRLKGSLKVREVKMQEYSLQRNLQHMVTLYAFDDQPEPESWEASHLTE